VPNPEEIAGTEFGTPVTTPPAVELYRVTAFDISPETLASEAEFVASIKR
jgi:hypothetical protein